MWNCIHVHHPTTKYTNVTPETHFVILCLLHSSVGVSSISVQPVNSYHIWVPFTALSFFSFGKYPDGTFHRGCQRQLPYFLGNIPGRIAGNGVSTCCTPRHSMRKVAPPQFQCTLLRIFSNVSQALFSATFNLFLQSGSWKTCCTWGPMKMPQTSLHYTRSPSIENYFATFNCLFL